MLIQNTPQQRRYNPPVNQQGIAIIVVLLVLLLITLIGTLAVRQSTTDLRLSTSAQVEKLLFQSNDAAFMKVEKEDRILGARRGSAETLKGYMSSSQRDGHEVSFCVRPRSDRLFSVLEISERNRNGERLNGVGNGYCDPSDSEDYVSEGRVITQMTFVRPLGSDKEAVFFNEVEGTYSNDFQKPEDDGSGGILCSSFEGYATSVLPAMSNVDLGDARSSGTDTVAGCLKQPRQTLTPTTITLDACLTALGVPFSTHKQVFRNQPVGVNCIADE